MAFNPNEHLMKIGTGQYAQEYLQVKWRLAWFRDVCPGGSIETEIIQLDLDREVTAEVMVWSDEQKKKIKVLKTAKGYCVCRAIVRDGNGGVGTGTKSEAAVDFNDFIEKAESGAIGRALATLGYGTQFTGDEFDEKHRIVDSPVETSAQTTQTASETPAKPATPAARTTPKAENKPAHTAPVSESQPVEQSNDFRPEGATEQALGRLAQRCTEIAGTEKGPAMYLRIYKYARDKFHIGSDISDTDTPNEVLTEMWNQVRKAERQSHLAKAS